jgi:hypothetical protein
MRRANEPEQALASLFIAWGSAGCAAELHFLLTRRENFCEMK